MGEIIYKHKIVFISRKAQNRRCPYIGMKQLKREMSTAIGRRKREAHALPNST
jgi:hypothetical protein